MVHVDKQSALNQLPVISLFFFYFINMGILSIFWPLYLRQLNYSYFLIGMLLGSIPLIKCFSPLVTGLLADYFKRSILLVRYIYGFSVIGTLGMFSTHTWVLFLSTLFFGFFWTSLISLFDMLILERYRSVDYSMIRLWGSVGFLVVVLVSIVLPVEAHIAHMPYYLTGVSLLGFLGCFLIQQPILNNKTYPSFSVTVVAKIGAKQWPMVLVFLLLQGMHGVYYGFFSIDLIAHHYSMHAVGIFWCVGILAEIGVFIWLPKYLEKIHFKHALNIACLVGTMRWWLTPFFIDNPFVLLGIQALHGITFGLSHMLAIRWYKHHFTPRYLGSGMAIYSASSFGLGVFLFTYVSGFLWEITPISAYILAGGGAILAMYVANVKQ